MKPIRFYSIGLGTLIFFLLLATANGQQHGDVIRAQGDTKIYLIQNGQRRAITTEQVFRQMGFKLSDVKELDPLLVMGIPLGPPLLSKESIAPFPEGTLIRERGTNRAYVIKGERKCFIPDPETLLALGYQWDQAKEVDRTTFDRINTGIPVASTKQPYQYTTPGGASGTQSSGVPPGSTTSTTASPIPPDPSSLFSRYYSPYSPPSSDSSSGYPYDAFYYPPDPDYYPPDPDYYPPDPDYYPESSSSSSYLSPRSIIRIDPKRLTLRDDKGKQTVIGMKDASQFRIGEKVIIKDNMLLKLGAQIRPECIVIKVEGLKVTVSRENDQTKCLAVGANSTKGLRIGDKVKVQNCELSVMKGAPAQMIYPAGIITWISQNNVVVAQENDKTKSIMLAGKNATGLKVGDRVRIQGCELIKVVTTQKPTFQPVIKTK